MDPSLGRDENGHIRGSVTGFDSAFGSIQDLDRVVYEPAHNSLIAAWKAGLNLFRALVGQP